jgi:riboflavin synthase
MFTGLVEATGKVEAFRKLAGGGARLTVTTPFAAELAPGDSVAVDGVCLTAIAPRRGRFDADLSPETLLRTTLGTAAGRIVNLERALRAGDRLGGHIVQGHVDGTTSVTAIRKQRDFEEWTFAVPKGLGRYLVEKGSVALDGISLTVASLAARSFTVALIPKTLESTALRVRGRGGRVNVEVDLLAKYVERLLAARR